MKKYLFVVLSILAFIIPGCSNNKFQYADMVMINGTIITMDERLPNAEAIAVKGDTILDVGWNRKIKKYISDSTEVIDLKGQFTIPGLIDGHGHYMSLGESLMGIDLKKPKNWDEIVELVAAEVKKVERHDAR